MYYGNYLYELIKSIPQGVREPRLNKTLIKCTVWFSNTMIRMKHCSIYSIQFQKLPHRSIEICSQWNGRL